MVINGYGVYFSPQCTWSGSTYGAYYYYSIFFSIMVVLLVYLPFGEKTSCLLPSKKVAIYEYLNISYVTFA